MKRLFNIKGAALFLLAIICTAALGSINMVDEMAQMAKVAYQSCTMGTVMAYVAGAKSSLSSGMGMASMAGVIPLVLKSIDGKTFEVKSDEEIGKLDDEAKGEYLAGLVKAQSSNMARIEAEILKAKDYEKAALTLEINALHKQHNETLNERLKTMGVEMKSALKELEAKTEGKPLTLKNAILKSLNDNSEELLGLKGTNKNLTLEVKAFQTAGDIDSGTDFAEMESGVGQIATRQPFMRSLFRNVNTSKEYVKYNDQETIVRDAKNVAACAASTHNSKITWKVRTMQITKVRDYVDVCIDMMDDYDYVQGEITNLVDTDVKLKVDEGLLLGDGVYPNLTGVASVASTFVAGDYAASVSAPTLFDLIVVAAAQISDFGLNNKFQANVAVVNPVDATKMRLEKDKDCNYLLPSFVSNNGTQLGAIRIIENQLVPVGEFYIMDSTKGTVYSRRGISIDFGYENNDNFEREIVTVKAYERLNLRVRNVDANAFMHVADIDAALVAITKV